MRILSVVFLSLSLALPAAAEGKRPRDSGPSRSHALADLLHRIPADAAGDVYMTDLAAARRQTDPMTRDAPSDRDRMLAPMSAAMLPPGFDRDRIAMHLDDPSAALGVSLFALGQVAGWGTLPEAPVVVTGIGGHEAAIVAALERDGLTPKDVGETQVWHIRDDFEIDIRSRSDTPFGGNLGMSQRIALAGDVLLSARSWPGIERLLDPGATLAGDADVAAISDAVHGFQGAGDVINMVLVPEQPPKMPDPGMFLSLFKDMTPAEAQKRIAELPVFRLPGLPRFLRFGMILWQDGRKTTGAIAIPYIRRDTAETARDRFTALLEAGTSPSARRGFAEILPYERRFEIVEAGNRHVLILAFVHHAEADQPVTMMTLYNNPQSRLYQMYVNRDLALLIGH